MSFTKSMVIAVLFIVALGCGHGALASSLTINMPANTLQTPVPIAWPQSSISVSQLQGLFGQNPGAQQFDIQFPNGMNWNVTPNQIQSLYSQFSEKAAALGYGQIPDLSFSSLGGNGLDASALTIPISDAMGTMQQEANAALDALHEQGSSFLDSLPDVFKTIVQAIENGFMVLFNFAWDTIKSWFK